MASRRSRPSAFRSSFLPALFTSRHTHTGAHAHSAAPSSHRPLPFHELKKCVLTWFFAAVIHPKGSTPKTPMEKMLTLLNITRMKGNVFPFGIMVCCVIPCFFQPVERRNKYLKGNEEQKCWNHGYRSCLFWGTPTLFLSLLYPLSLSCPVWQRLQEGIIWSYLRHWLYGVGSSEFHRTGQNVTAFGPRSL